MDYQIIAFPPTHSLAFLNGTQIVYLENVGGGSHRFRMINRAFKAANYIGVGKGLDEIFINPEYTKWHFNRYHLRPLSA